MGAGLTTLFALADALVNEAVRFLGNSLVAEVCVGSNNSFEAIIEHFSDIEEIEALPDLFSRPDGTNDMRMPVLAGIAIDNSSSGGIKSAYVIRRAMLCEKDI